MRKDAMQTGLRRDSNRDTLEQKHIQGSSESEGELQEDTEEPAVQGLAVRAGRVLLTGETQSEPQLGQMMEGVLHIKVTFEL